MGLRAVKKNPVPEIQGHKDKYRFIDEELARREDSCQMRRLRPLNPVSGAEVSVGGRTMINFCSNDYLGLSKHPEVIKRAGEYTRKYGAGSTASRLVAGTFECMERLEEKLARLKGTQSALLLNSGFQANVSLMSALTDKDSIIFSDRLNHNSLIQGARLAKCETRVVAHNDLFALEKALQEVQGGKSRMIIATESVFSMDGDRADIPALADLAERYGALLFVDEAHATGVLGENGMGLCRGENVDLVMGTCGKALGSFGAYVACSHKMRDYLINCLTGFIYSTSLPPAVIGAVDAALSLLPGMEKERESLMAKADYLRRSLSEMGFDTGESSTQIIPVIIGDEKRTLDLSGFLEANEIFALAIRPPSVEPGKSRIRLTLSAAHTWDQVEKLVEVFKLWKQPKGLF